MDARFKLPRFFSAGWRLAGTILLGGLLLAAGTPAMAEPGKSWFVDKQGREHPGYGFRFTDKAKLGRAIAAQESQIDRKLNKRGVVGSAIGWDAAGNPVIRVFGDGAVATDLPAFIGGFPVRLEATGAVYALKYTCREDNRNRARQCPDAIDAENSLPGASPAMLGPTSRYRPVPNGVSIGHFNITAGTVGCLVTQGCHPMVLSNNHVLADSNAGSVDDPILQPGPFDGGINPIDEVATLFDWVPIIMSTSATNRVDAAIALINDGDFTNTTLPDGYGQPRADWMVPQAGMTVMKSGRTTGFTEGIITGVNAIVHVNYTTCCARFVGQVVIEPLPGYADFALGGDSGSLLVASGGPNDRRPVGLVFALAEDGSVFANPIDDVVNELDINFIAEN